MCRCNIKCIYIYIHWLINEFFNCSCPPGSNVSSAASWVAAPAERSACCCMVGKVIFSADARVYSYPHAPCIVYLPTFTSQMTQKWANKLYVEHMETRKRKTVSGSITIANMVKITRVNMVNLVIYPPVICYIAIERGLFLGCTRIETRVDSCIRAFLSCCLDLVTHVPKPFACYFSCAFISHIIPSCFVTQTNFIFLQKSSCAAKWKCDTAKLSI